MIYYDALIAGLVPVQFIAHLDGPLCEVRVARARGPYRKGETIVVHRGFIVRKSGRRGAHQLVVAASEEDLDAHRTRRQA